MFDTATAPAETGDGRPKPEGLVDHLIIVRINEYSQTNPMGIMRERDGAETPADCIRADIVDLDNGDGVMYLDYIFLQSKLIAHFKANVGKTLIGMLGKHPDQGARKGAYYFTDQSKVSRNVALGRAWMENNGPAWNGREAAPAVRATETRDDLNNQHPPKGNQSTLESMRSARSSFEGEPPF